MAKFTWKRRNVLNWKKNHARDFSDFYFLSVDNLSVRHFVYSAFCLFGILSVNILSVHIMSAYRISRYDLSRNLFRFYIYFWALYCLLCGLTIERTEMKYKHQTNSLVRLDLHVQTSLIFFTYSFLINGYRLIHSSSMGLYILIYS